MATTEPFDWIVIDPTAHDGAMALVDEAGWNQIEADWRLMEKAGNAIGLKTPQGRLVATALALPYPPGFGWISMVLVAADMRRRGLATSLMRNRIGWLQERGLTPVLDASELGQPVYEKIGFVAGQQFTRWQGAPAGDRPADQRIRPATPTDRAWIVALDGAVFGAPRPTVLGDFLDRSGGCCWVDGDGQTGFVITRPGRRATQVGPLVAADEAAAVALLGTAFATCDGPVFLDALDVRRDLAAFIRSQGLTRQRGFARMSLGAIHDFSGDGRSMLIAGPEYG